MLPTWFCKTHALGNQIAHNFPAIASSATPQLAQCAGPDTKLEDLIAGTRSPPILLIELVRMPTEVSVLLGDGGA